VNANAPSMPVALLQQSPVDLAQKEFFFFFFAGSGDIINEIENILKTRII